MKGKHLYYRCTDRAYNYPLPKTCPEKGINARIADEFVWDTVKSILVSPKLLMSQAKRLLSEVNNEPSKSSIANIDLNKELSKLKSEEDRYIKIFGQGIIAEDQLKKYLEDLRIKMTSLRGQIMKIDEKRVEIKRMEPPTEDELEAFCQKAKAVLDYYNFEEKQITIREIVDKITGDQTELTVNGYIPIEKNYEFKTIHRNSRLAQRW